MMASFPAGDVAREGKADDKGSGPAKPNRIQI